ncbi:hypothetical protein JAAARDRAFT_320178 [Jaapia argillacea MUCL 33604]|uniref:Uncharacterized protein n=1 Tax=Jaapia argillacea MUCL 33604 TaxID=933084 RepID=A0A067PMS4_9AGAM|nr:hypothetical protein JAAARDRAFT_320178 [Jaapia argillacea MUCL 33604]
MCSNVNYQVDFEKSAPCQDWKGVDYHAIPPLQPFPTIVFGDICCGIDGTSLSAKGNFHTNGDQPIIDGTKVEDMFVFRKPCTATKTLSAHHVNQIATLNTIVDVDNLEEEAAGCEIGVVSSSSSFTPG